MVNNKITTSVEQFANSWLVTKSSECIVKESNNEAPACNKAPSERCIELFKSKSSPLAKYFSQVDPIPFLKTCQIDTADCKDTISYCDSVAAYLALLKMGGVAARNIKDCRKYYDQFLPQILCFRLLSQFLRQVHYVCLYTIPIAPFIFPRITIKACLVSLNGPSINEVYFLIFFSRSI